jgi:hypothetical protein
MAFIVREFDFVGVIQQLHDGSNLAAYEAVRWNIGEKSDDVQEVRCRMHSVA